MLLLYFVLLSAVWSRFVSDVYPKAVPKYEVRKDVHTNETVQSGLLHTLSPKSTLSEFNRYLQCPPTQPNLNHNGGLISKLRLSTTTSEDFKLFCARIESHCKQWNECRSNQVIYEAGDFTRNDNFNCLNEWSRSHLSRVIKGKLFLDWPWGVDRFEKKDLSDTMLPLIKMTLDRISDMRDSVFFTGGDTPSLPFDHPMPIFSHATSDPYADMVWPWYEMWQDANRVYKRMREEKLDFSNAAFEKLEEGYLQWEHKVPKAAYFATNQGLVRQFMFEVARLHPDLMDARFIEDLIYNWNPESTEDSMNPEEKKALAHNATAVEEAQKLPAGYGEPLANISALGGYTHYHPGAYKYIVVPISAGLSTSGRLQHVMSSSGAVVMLQRSRTKYHVSAQMKPWVHYVPLSYTGADIAEKVRWLREHDDMARQIAENGRNFARSHLRLEDYYCYAAAALDMMADVTSEAAKTTFNPQELPAFEIHFGDKAAYEYPV